MFQNINEETINLDSENTGSDKDKVNIINGAEYEPGVPGTTNNSNETIFINKVKSEK